MCINHNVMILLMLWVFTMFTLHNQHWTEAILTVKIGNTFHGKAMKGRGLSTWQSTWGKWWLTHCASLLRWIWSISEYNLTTRDWLDRVGSKRYPKIDQVKCEVVYSGIVVHHKSDRKSCVIPTADRNSPGHMGNQTCTSFKNFQSARHDL